MLHMWVHNYFNNYSLHTWNQMTGRCIKEDEEEEQCWYSHSNLPYWISKISLSFIFIVVYYSGREIFFGLLEDVMELVGDFQQRFGIFFFLVILDLFKPIPGV